MKFLYCELNNDYAYTATPAVYQPPAKTPIDDANVWKIGIDIDTADLIKDDAADPKYSRDSFKAYLQSPAGYSDLTDNQIENVLNRFFPAAAQSGETPADIPAKLTDADISKALQDNGINIDASKQSVTVRDNLRIIASDPELLQKFAAQCKVKGTTVLLESLNVPKNAEELRLQFGAIQMPSQMPAKDGVWWGERWDNLSIGDKINEAHKQFGHLTEAELYAKIQEFCNAVENGQYSAVQDLEALLIELNGRESGGGLKIDELEKAIKNVRIVNDSAYSAAQGNPPDLRDTVILLALLRGGKNIVLAMLDSLASKDSSILSRELTASTVLSGIAELGVDFMSDTAQQIWKTIIKQDDKYKVYEPHIETLVNNYKDKNVLRLLLKLQTGQKPTQEDWDAIPENIRKSKEFNDAIDKVGKEHLEILNELRERARNTNDPDELERLNGLINAHTKDDDAIADDLESRGFGDAAKHFREAAKIGRDTNDYINNKLSNIASEKTSAPQPTTSGVSNANGTLLVGGGGIYTIYRVWGGYARRLIAA